MVKWFKSWLANQINFSFIAHWISEYLTTAAARPSQDPRILPDCTTFKMYDVAHLGSEERWLLARQLRWWPLGYLVLIIITINCPPSALWSSHTAAQSQVLKITSSQFTFFIKNWNVSNIWEFPQLQPQLNSQQEEVFLQNNGISCVVPQIDPSVPQLVFTITEKAPSLALSWFKAPT